MGRATTLVLMALVGTTGCKDGKSITPPEKLAPETRIQQRYPSLFENDTLQLAAVVVSEGGDTLSNAAVGWESRNSAVAQVSGTGLVTALRPGSAQIIASSGSGADSVQVVVLPRVLRPNREIAYLELVLPANRPSHLELRLASTNGSPPVRISEAFSHVSFFSWAPSGDHLVVSYTGEANSPSGSYIISPAGQEIHEFGEFLWTPRWSPDGRQLVYRNHLSSGQSDIYVVSSTGLDKRRLTDDAGDELEPKWSPDGRQIMYLGNVADDCGELRLMAADGSDPRKIETPACVSRAEWSPDGKYVLFSTTDGVWLVNADGSRFRTVTQHSEAAYDFPAWTPDARRIAYLEVSPQENCFIGITDLDGAPPISIDAGPCHGYLALPRWSPDGTKIVFNGQGDDGSVALIVVNEDGSGARAVATGPILGPEWRP